MGRTVAAPCDGWQDLTSFTFEALSLRSSNSCSICCCFAPTLCQASPQILLFSPHNSPAKYRCHFTWEKTKNWSCKSDSAAAGVIGPGFEATSTGLQNLCFLYKSLLLLDFYCLACTTCLAQVSLTRHFQIPVEWDSKQEGDEMQ